MALIPSVAPVSDAHITSVVKAIPGNAIARLSRRISDITDSPPDRVTWLTWGDSLAQVKYDTFQDDLKRSLGGYCGAYFSGTSDGISNNATTGTITQSTTSFSVWPTGVVDTFATSATRTYGIGGGTFPSDTFTLYYIKESGAGTFTIQCDGVDTSAVGVSAANASTALGIETVTVAQGSHAFKVICVTGTIRVIGCGIIDTTRSGLVNANIANGGLSLQDAMSNSTARTMLQGVLADINPTVISTEMKEDSSYYATELAKLFTDFAAGAPDANVIGIGSTPIAVNDAGQVVQNSQLRAACEAFGYIYWDGYAPFGSYAALTDLGWEGDGTHVATAASSYLAGIMLRDLGVMSDLQQRATRDFSVASGIVSDEIIFNDAAETLTPTATIQRTSSNLDLTFTGKRNIIFTGAGGTMLYLAVSGEEDNQLPRRAQIGAGKAYLQGYSSVLAGISRAGTEDTADFTARIFAPTVVNQTLAAPGAVTITPANGEIQRVTLQANASAINVDVAAYDGQRLVLMIVQDGSGGHTFSWPTDRNRYAANTAPTPTTTANRADIVTFMSWSSHDQWIEVSRSINVPVV